MSKYILLFLSLLLLLSSCKKELYQATFFERKRLKIEEFEFEYLQAKSKIKYDDGIQSFNANATIRIRNDSAIWISFSSTGVEGVRALIQKDSIFVIDRINKKFREFSFDSLKRAYNMDFNYAMIQALLVGNLMKSRIASDKVVKENEFFILKQNSDNLAIKNYVNSKTMKIEKVNIIEQLYSGSMEIKYEDFQFNDEMLFPYKNSVFLTYKRDNSEFTSNLDINFSRVAINEKKMKFPFNVPNRYAANE
jgi:hypothetical protein